MKRRMWYGLAGIGLVGVTGAAFLALRPKDEVKWRTAKVERGNLVQRISATGTLSALVQVPVGTQVSGTIISLSADYNSLVRKGQVIAQIDPTVWESQMKDAEASLERAKANLEDARRNFDRTKRLAAEKLVSEQELDAKDVALKTAKASHDTAKAAVDRARANLGYCTITAPVDGVVVARSVDVGQTVAASFNTPNLFTIAQDLSKMKLEVSIDEADIGQVKVGQSAFFTVDAYQDKQFRGTVSQVRLEPITQQNVVTYKVVMEVQNEPLATDGVEPAKATPAATERKEAKPSAPAPQAARPQAGPQGGAGQGAGFNPDEIWERNKERIQERNPGITKEEWLQRMKERMAQGGGPGRPGGMGHQGGAAPQAASGGQPKRLPGGINFAAGPIYSGNLALRPGMTANVTIFTNRREAVLRVPSVALRFNPATFDKSLAPKPAATTPGQGQAQQGGQRPTGGPGMGGGAPRGMVSRREDKVWVLEKGVPKQVVVKAGISDGQYTEISGEGVAEGMEVLTGADDPTKKAATQGASPLGGPGGPPRR